MGVFLFGWEVLGREPLPTVLRLVGEDAQLALQASMS
jgi:hypothetical protein